MIRLLHPPLQSFQWDSLSVSLRGDPIKAQDVGRRKREGWEAKPRAAPQNPWHRVGQVLGLHLNLGEVISALGPLFSCVKRGRVSQKHWQLISCVCVCVCVLVAQLCPILCDPMDCSTSGSSVHGILQARILEWIAIPFSRGSSWSRDQTQVSHIAGGFFTFWATSCFILKLKVFFLFFWSDRFVVYVVSFNTLFLRYHECSDVVYILLCFFVLYWGVHAYLLYFWHKPFFQRLFFRALLCLQDWVSSFSPEGHLT